MNTDTKQVTETGAAAIDIDTRLTMAAAGMDAILGHKHGEILTEASEQLAAVKEAAAEQSAADNPSRGHNKILKAAGDLIRVRGWTKGTYVNESGALCTLGAIRTAARGVGWFGKPHTDEELRAMGELLRRISAEFGPDHLSIPRWNDGARDVNEVLKLLY